MILASRLINSSKQCRAIRSCTAALTSGAVHVRLGANESARSPLLLKVKNCSMPGTSVEKHEEFRRSQAKSSRQP